MNRRINLAISVILLVFGCSTLGAESGVLTTVGTFIETETNNAHWAAANLTVAPGLNFGLAGKVVPIYGWLHFENRELAAISENGYTGQELRSKFRFGSNLKLEKTAFNPEYELRVKYFVGIPVSELSIYENRFKLNFNFPVGNNWAIYLKAMPTLIININENRDDTGGEKVFLDYYQEFELGAGWSWNQHNTLLLGIYNELGIDQAVTNSDGSINGGKNFGLYEFQARLVYKHEFRNGIHLDPFARIGIVRNFLYEKTPGEITTGNFRRDRFGFNLKYSAENGLRPNMEGYYQRSNMGSGPVQHRFYWKIGLDYQF